MGARQLSGAALALAAVAALLLAGARGAHGQLSPGPLSRAHAKLEGAANCLQCHQAGKGVAPARCLDCHTALRARIQAKKGLHARAEYQRCETCHIEHHGREFELVFWGKSGRASFDHRKTGFTLAGAHARLQCQACHRPGLVRNHDALRRGGANPQRTFLGLGTACVNCHRDEHRAQFAGRACVSCHDQAAWKPAPGFDHQKTAFPLTGEHREVACASCHPRKAAPQGAAPQPGDSDGAFLQLRGIAHSTCASCHRDPHAGRMGQQCQQCHTTAGWREGARARFDHDKTGFPLTGAHRQVACASCHKTRGPQGETTFGRMAHARCSDCHRDPHAGRMGQQCQQCHTTAGWRGGTARAGLDHDKTRFPLRGRHREVACQSCHPPGQPLRRGGFERCASCHRDPHAGQLARTAAGATTCESCHTVDGFSPSTFTVAAHQRAWPLQGAHLAVPCVACHRTVAFGELPARVRERAASPRPARTQLFRFASTGCPSCHGDPHRGEVARFVEASGCTSCHRVESWRQIAFDHDRTKFALVGAHATAACRSCHPAVEGSGAAPGRLRFRGVATDCASCHRNPHPTAATARSGSPARGAAAANVASPVSTRCADCHSALGWAHVRFDRDRHPRFPLAGAHRELACGACHRATVVAGRRQLAFSPLPTTCEGCHGGSAASR